MHHSLKKYFIPLIGLILISQQVYAQNDGQFKFLKAAPQYFGPYAFPVPDMLDGSICNDLYIELSGDAVIGNIAGNGNEDYTYAPTFCFHVPLWSNRATLSLWGEFREMYRDNIYTRAARGIELDEPLRASDAGSLYFSLDMQILKESVWRPAIALKAAVQTATGDDYEKARHYDAPGYYFELSTGKDFNMGEGWSVRPSASLNFICWQVDNGKQNDALGYGAQLAIKHPVTTFSVAYGQYKGKDGDGDMPRVIKSRLDFHIGRWSPFVYFQHGFREWPFNQYRIGLAYRMDILRYIRK